MIWLVSVEPGLRQSYLERTSLIKLGGPVLKAPSVPVRRESSSQNQGRRKSMAAGKDKTEKESTENEKSENKTRRWVPDTDKHLPGKPFGWKIYQDSVRFSYRILIGPPQKAFRLAD